MTDKKWTPGLDSGWFGLVAEHKAYVFGFNEAINKTAALDLYEALDKLVDRLDDIRGLEMDVLAPNQIKDAQLALAKARGE